MGLPQLSARACLVLAFLGMISGLLPSDASAQHKFYLTKEEYLSLPTYCKAQRFMQRDSPIVTVPASEHAKWQAMLGPGFETMHHFCRGLIFMQRAASLKSPKEQERNYREAIANFIFVQRTPSVTQDFALLPEICLRKGFAHLLLDERVEAAMEFTEAIRLKPDYTPAYGAMIDYYVSFGELEEAQKVLETGLKHAPSSALLRQKETELKALRDPKTNPPR
jgi:hypothetical protein